MNDNLPSIYKINNKTLNEQLAPNAGMGCAMKECPMMEAASATRDGSLAQR